MDKWIALVRANMKDRKVTQDELAERLGMSQGGVGHWLNKRRVPSLADMNRVLEALGLGYLSMDRATPTLSPGWGWSRCGE